MTYELERGERATPIDNRSDPEYVAPTLRRGRDWPQARDQWPWTLLDPLAWIEFGEAVVMNSAQAAAIILTRMRG